MATRQSAFMVEITPNCETLRMPRDLSRRDPMKVAQYEVLGWRSERVTRPGRDDRLPACAREAVRERRGAKRFYRPCRDEHFFVHRFSPLSFIESLPPSPFGLRRTGRDRSAQARRSFLNAHARRSSLECQLVIANRRTGAEPVVGRFGLSRRSVQRALS